jgi:hypothetical protein
LRERREVELERIGLVDCDLRRVEAVPEPRREVAIDLDHVQVGEARGEMLGEQPRSRPDLGHRIGARRRDRRDDALEVVAIGKEVLPEPLAGTRQHRR